MIYFDNAATSYPKPKEVYKKMDAFYKSTGVNASRGSYDKSIEASNLIDNTRKNLLELFNCNNKEVIFTPSATLAINMILKGKNWKENDIILFSPFEHNAVLRTLYWLQKNFNIQLKKIPFEKNSFELKENEYEDMIKKYNPKMIITTQVSNVIGLILPIKNMANIAKKYNTDILVDGAQGAGVIDIDLSDVDYYIWAGHKSLFGPFGISGIIAEKRNLDFEPLILGGTGVNSKSKNMPDEIPDKFEAGSNNIHAISGLNASLKWIDKIGKNEIFLHEKKLTKKLIDIFNDYIDIQTYLPKNLGNHFNVVSISVSNYTPNEIGKILNEKFDIAVRTGLHCAPLAHELLGTLPYGLVRFSLGYFNKNEDLEYLNKCLDKFLL